MGMADEKKDRFVIIRERTEKGGELLKMELKEKGKEGFCYIETEGSKITLSCEGDIELIKKLINLDIARKRIEKI